MPRLLSAILVCLLAWWTVPAEAMESNVVTSRHDTASLVSDVDSVAAGKPFHVGLRLQLAQGWHTYWRNPGDAGVAPDLQLSLPDGRRSPSNLHRDVNVGRGTSVSRVCSPDAGRSPAG